MTRHLHRDYHTTHCGLDASYILMTYDVTETDCAACVEAAIAAHEREEADLAEHKRIEGVLAGARQGYPDAVAEARALHERRVAEAKTRAEDRAKIEAEEQAQKDTLRLAHRDALHAHLTKIKGAKHG